MSAVDGARAAPGRYPGLLVRPAVLSAGPAGWAVGEPAGASRADASDHDPSPGPRSRAAHQRGESGRSGRRAGAGSRSRRGAPLAGVRLVRPPRAGPHWVRPRGGRRRGDPWRAAGAARRWWGIVTVTQSHVEIEAIGAPEPCSWCRNPVVPTVLGWMHIDGSGDPAAWSCPPPHMTLAYPRPAPKTPESLTAPSSSRSGRRPTPIPPSPRHSRPPTPPEVPYA